MLTIKVIQWGTQLGDRKSAERMIFCVSVNEGFGGVQWFVWRSYEEFVGLWLSMLDHPVNTTMIEDIPMYQNNIGERETSFELKSLLECWLNGLLGLPAQSARGLLRCFLTSQANFTPPRLVLDSGLPHDKEHSCHLGTDWENTNLVDET